MAPQASLSPPGQHTTRYPSTALPSVPQKCPLLCVRGGGGYGYVLNMCCYVCNQARACVYMDIIVCVYISNCVFAGAQTGRNHFWWISTLALESGMFSSGWLMGFLTDACTNLLLLPLLLFPAPSMCMCVCKSLWISVLCTGCGCSFQLLLMNFPLFSWTADEECKGESGTRLLNDSLYTIMCWRMLKLLLRENDSLRFFHLLLSSDSNMMS